MPAELKPWRRKVVISDEILEKLPKEVVQALRDSSLSDKEKLRALLQHLYEVFRSYIAVAALIGVPAATVYNWMIRLNVDIREYEACKERRLAKIKKVAPKEMAKMWFFAHSDGCAIAMGRQVYVQVRTPDPWLIHLFTELFGRHVDIKVKPVIDFDGGSNWHAWCYLPIEGYSWILSDEPPSIMTGEGLWEALAVLIDTEGTITIRREKRGKATEVTLVIPSENLRLLQRIKHELRSNGIKAKLGRIKETGQETKVGRLNSDCWRLAIYAKPSLIRVLEEVADRLTLPWKHMLAKLSLRVLREQLAWSEVEDLVSEVRRFRRRTLDVSKRYILEQLAENPPRPST